MKIVLFRFEAELIHILELEKNGENISLWEKNKIWIIEKNRWEKYSKTLEIFTEIKNKFSPVYFAFQSPMKYRWVIKDEEWYVYWSLLHLFWNQNNINILELSNSFVRNELKLSAKDFKELMESQKNKILEKHKIAKSDKLLDGLISLSLINK